MRLYRGMRFAITWHACWMVALTCLCTFMCSKGMLDLKFNTSMTVLAAGTVFPLVFSVQAGFSRRDSALTALAKLKAAMLTAWLMIRTWERDESGKWAWQEGSACRWAGELQRLYAKILDDVELYLRSDRPVPQECGNVVYDGFVTLINFMDNFGPHCGHKKFGGEGGIGRMSTCHREMLTNFEEVRAILDNQMPIGLRLFCFALIHVTPIVLAPYWNRFCDEKRGNQPNYLTDTAGEYGCQAGYFIAVTYVLILITLYRVQKQLENPFDGDGLDDVNWILFRSHFDQLDTYGRHGPAKRAQLASIVSNVITAEPEKVVTAEPEQSGTTNHHLPLIPHS